MKTSRVRRNLATILGYESAHALSLIATIEVLEELTEEFDGLFVDENIELDKIDEFVESVKRVAIDLFAIAHDDVDFHRVLNKLIEAKGVDYVEQSLAEAREDIERARNLDALGDLGDLDDHPF